MDFLRKWFSGNNASSSAQIAKERLRLVLIHDRTDISPQLLENLRVEMISVLTKYMEIDESKIEMDLGRENNSVALVANIPVVRIKRCVVESLENNMPENRNSQHSEPSRNSNSKNRRRK
ncbi:MAG: cell division topological specificity factor MinE [Synergistaceae bacterium]|nr:cell division topological specificity factor MinE [Synergistaceae bacterium]